MIPAGIPFVVGFLAVATLFLVEGARKPWPAWSQGTNDLILDEEPDLDRDEVDDPYLRGFAEDDYLDRLIGEPRRGVE